MVSRAFYKSLSILSVVFGALILVEPKVNLMGKVIGTLNFANSTAPAYNLTNSTNMSFGLFFLIAGVALFLVQKANKKSE